MTTTCVAMRTSGGERWWKVLGSDDVVVGKIERDDRRGTFQAFLTRVNGVGYVFIATCPTRLEAERVIAREVGT